MTKERKTTRLSPHNQPEALSNVDRIRLEVGLLPPILEKLVSQLQTDTTTEAIHRDVIATLFAPSPEQSGHSIDDFRMMDKILFTHPQQVIDRYLIEQKLKDPQYTEQPRDRYSRLFSYKAARLAAQMIPEYITTLENEQVGQPRWDSYNRLIEDIAPIVPNEEQEKLIAENYKLEPIDPDTGEQYAGVARMFDDGRISVTTNAILDKMMRTRISQEESGEIPVYGSISAWERYAEILSNAMIGLEPIPFKNVNHERDIKHHYLSSDYIAARLFHFLPVINTVRFMHKIHPDRPVITGWQPVTNVISALTSYYDEVTDTLGDHPHLQKTSYEDILFFVSTHINDWEGIHNDDDQSTAIGLCNVLEGISASTVYNSIKYGFLTPDEMNNARSIILGAKSKVLLQLQDYKQRKQDEESARKSAEQEARERVQFEKHQKLFRKRKGSEDRNTTRL